jgi:hypothetical protein
MDRETIRNLATSVNEAWDHLQDDDHESAFSALCEALNLVPDERVREALATLANIEPEEEDDYTLVEFLQHEREILEAAGLESEIIDRVLVTAIAIDINSAEFNDEEVLETVQEFRNAVCAISESNNVPEGDETRIVANAALSGAAGLLVIGANAGMDQLTQGNPFGLFMFLSGNFGKAQLVPAGRLVRDWFNRVVGS